MCAVSGAIPCSEKLVHVKDSTQSQFPRKCGVFLLLFVSLTFSIVFAFVVLKKLSRLEIVQSAITAKSTHSYQIAFSYEGIGMWFSIPGAANEGYTTVHTVLSVVSNLTALASVGFMFVSYMGFSNDACPFVFSCPAQPLYWTFGLVLPRGKKLKNQSCYVMYVEVM